MSQQQKDLVRRLHINTGHPPQDRFLRTLRAAGALPHVLRYVKEEFKCETCSVKRGVDPRRRAQCPRTFSFNKILSIDVFFIPFRNHLEPILNVVCHGTNYQLAQRIESTSGAPSAHATWRALLTTWIRYLGAPSLIITDGGKEFQGRFERGLEQLGILQHVTAPESPWQNSRAERHGGWLKQKLNQELDAGQGVVSTKEDLDELLAALVSAKNRWFNHGGYTPTQMVFGELPRVPGELLSSDETGLPVLSDAFHDPAGMDEAATEFKQRHRVRERARQLAMEETSREAVKRAVRAAPHVCRHWAVGQWVYVFRRGRSGDSLHPTSRWVGPGVIVTQTSSVIWVAMRTRLWRCSPEQLRAAFPSEVLGRQLASDPQLGELLRKVISGNQAGAVDVTKELPPTENDHLAPIDRESHEAGIPVKVEARERELGDSPPPLEPPQAFRDPIAVPPGLERRLGTIPEEALARDGVVPSRRSFVQEPAQEPETSDMISGPRQTPEAANGIPGNPTEEASPEADSEPDGPHRPHKAARLDHQENGEVSARAPGTPIRRLLQAVQRGRDLTARGSDEQPSRSRSRTPEPDRELFSGTSPTSETPPGFPTRTTAAGHSWPAEATRWTSRSFRPRRRLSSMPATRSSGTPS